MINYNELKTGKIYYLRLKITDLLKKPDGKRLIIGETVDTKGEAIEALYIEEDELDTLCHRVDILSPAPKYDPCRRFKKGDKVRVVQKWGRIPASAGTIGEVYTVAEDEENEKRITLVSKRNGYFWCDFFHLELVTPVEELEPYYVGDCKDDPDCQFFYIQNNNNEISSGLLEEVARFVYNTDYTADKETARKRAEEYCDSLNAEYRKEEQK